VLLSLVVFCETGLVITPFLPGDSLLFAAGSLIASTSLNVHVLVFSLIVAALCGDNCNYWLGRFVGPKVFTDRSRWFKREYLLKTHAFYERYGAKAIFIARFIPIVRTFTPFVAGIGAMRYKKFLSCSVLAAIVWVGLLIYTGYWFGSTPFVEQHFSSLILLIIVISVLPGLIGFLKRYSSNG
jgi:membrane-associated protein